MHWRRPKHLELGRAARYTVCLVWFHFLKWLVQGKSLTTTSEGSIPGNSTSTLIVHSNQHKGLCLWLSEGSCPVWTRIKVKSWNCIVFVELFPSRLTLSMQFFILIEGEKKKDWWNCDELSRPLETPPSAHSIKCFYTASEILSTIYMNVACLDP